MTFYVPILKYHASIIGFYYISCMKLEIFFPKSVLPGPTAQPNLAHFSFSLGTPIFNMIKEQQGFWREKGKGFLLFYCCFGIFIIYFHPLEQFFVFYCCFGKFIACFHPLECIRCFKWADEVCHGQIPIHSMSPTADDRLQISIYL